MTCSRDWLGAKDKQIPIVYRVIKCLFAVAIVAILFINVAFYWLDYKGTRRTWQIINNPILLPISICLVGVIFAIVYKAKFKFKRFSADAVFIVASLLFLILQVFLVRQYYFETAWDAATVRDSAINIVNVDSPDPDWWPDYYDVNPNNRTIVSLFTVVIRVMSTLTIDDPNFGLILFQCGISWMTGVVLYFTVKRLTNSRRPACVAWLIYAVSVGLSPWVSIPYSDGVGLIIPITMILLLTIKSQRSLVRTLKWLALGGLGYLSLQIKPQTTIMLIAILIVVGLGIIVDKIRNGQPIFTRQRIINMTALVGGMCLVMIPIKLINDTLVPIKLDRNLPITHYLMMGMNSETDGIYSGDDVWFISLDGVYKEGDGSSPPSRVVTTDEIADRNIKELINRLKEMGIVGTAKLLVRKSLVNFNDGAFAWSGEGNFYWSVKPSSSELAQSIREIFYIPDKGNGVTSARSKYKYFQTIEQGIWLAVLFFSIFSVLGHKKSRVIVSMMLGVIGLIVYEMLFEARARYIYTYVPIFILLAVYGMERLYKLICNKCCHGISREN